mmetsp:Transcript_587/g.1216  ORF Transcript_587/g.1216 Transcript_587/m.1216 type:complete len:475 (-) Transcript_587:187-1611(-)
MWSTRKRVSCDSPRPSAKRKRSDSLLTFLSLSVAIFALSIDGVVCDDSNSYEDARETKRVHDIIVEDWYDLIRYLVGLGLCIFGLIGMYFHQFASYNFVRKYSRPRETEHRIGRVLLCEPIVRNPSGNMCKEKKQKNNGGKAKTAPVLPTTKMDEGERAHSGSVTNYVREEDIEQQRDQLDMESDHRIFVVYSVPHEPSTYMLCCHPVDNDIGINFTNSFSVNSFSVNSLAPDKIDSDRIDTCRSRSLPPEASNQKDKRSKMSTYVLRNDGTEYFQWFETSTPKAVDSDIDLILLKGYPKSACIPELIQSHLEQVGIGEGKESDKHKYYKSLSMFGLALVTAIAVLTFVCVVEILSMPNAETQRPIGFTFLGIHFAASIVGAYLFAKLRFEQYKNEVFLSAVPVTATFAHFEANGEEDANDTSSRDEKTSTQTTRCGEKSLTQWGESTLSCKQTIHNSTNVDSISSTRGNERQQ